VEWDRGAGDQEKRGAGGVWEMGEEGGRKLASFSRWWEAGEKGKNYASLQNILQLKKCKEAGANKYRVGAGTKGYRKREVYTPLCMSPPLA